MKLRGGVRPVSGDDSCKRPGGGNPVFLETRPAKSLVAMAGRLIVDMGQP